MLQVKDIFLRIPIFFTFFELSSRQNFRTLLFTITHSSCSDMKIRFSFFKESTKIEDSQAKKLQLSV